MKKFVRYSLQAIGALTVLTLIAGLCTVTFAGFWMNVDETPTQADYILPLAGDRHRMIKAAEFYREGYAPVILLSNAKQLPPSRLQKLQWEMGYPNYSREQYLDILLRKLGAANAHLEEFGNGHTSTVEEAEALRVFLDGKPAKLLIVTSPYHAKRAEMIFKETLPHCTITMATTEEGAFEKWWWKDQNSAQLLTMEFMKTIHYLLGGVYRSSDPVPAQ